MKLELKLINNEEINVITKYIKNIFKNAVNSDFHSVNITAEKEEMYLGEKNKINLNIIYDEEIKI